MNFDTNTYSQKYELTPQRCIQLLIEQRRVWLSLAVGCGMLAMLYALLMTRYWEACQGLLVRDEASVSSSKQPGKFSDLYEMRTFQETILEVAKSQQVVTATLNNVSKAETGDSVPEPSAQQVEQFRKRLSMTPPNGAEFGKTEVFYFSIKDPNRERAIKLVAELGRQLSLRLRELRKERSEGLVEEFEKQVKLASKVHQVENSKLKEFESQIGPDLGELRLLHSATGGQSDLRQQLVELEKETRTAEARLREAEDLLIVLQAAQDDPEQLVAMPNSLLKIQPTLQRLKNGLVDAQLQASKLSGTRTEVHPQVKAALDAVSRIREELHDELAFMIEGLRVEVGLSNNRLEVLNSQLSDIRERLNRLAEYRAEYSSRVACAESSRSMLSQARRQLNEVRAKQVAIQSAQLVTPIDVPDTGPYTVGLSRTMVVILGTLAGAVVGIGWVFLTFPTEAMVAAIESEEVKQSKSNSVPKAFTDPVVDINSLDSFDPIIPTPVRVNTGLPPTSTPFVCVQHSNASIPVGG